MRTMSTFFCWLGALTKYIIIISAQHLCEVWMTIYNFPNENKKDWTPLYLSCIAGASTCIGAAIVFIQPRSKTNLQRNVSPGTMAFSLALAGSVMITVSVISILPEVFMDKAKGTGEKYEMIGMFSMEMLKRILFIALGALLYFGLSYFLSIPEPENLIQKENLDAVLGRFESVSPSKTEVESLVPSDSNSSVDQIDHDSPQRKSSAMVGKISQHNLMGRLKHIVKSVTGNKKSSLILCTKWARGRDLESNEQKKAWRVAVLMFISLLVHNFPEGLAVAVSALESEKLGITVTIGIMIHNIPEGIAIAIPCLAARPDKPWLSFVLASLSGLAEPIGAFFALIFLRDAVENEEMFYMEYVLGFVAGIMVMVSLWELFPEAKEHSGEDRSYFWAGTISGVVVMMLTELYLP